MKDIIAWAIGWALAGSMYAAFGAYIVIAIAMS